jgi:hypothetical protein
MPAPVESRIFGRQIGRLVFGGVLLISATWLVAALAVGSFNSPGGMPMRLPLSHRIAYPTLGQIVVVTWIAAVAAGAAARWLAAIAAGAAARWITAWRSGGPGSDARFAASLIVPTVGIALLLPITLHLPIVTLLTSYNFDLWARINLWLTWHAHLVFACLAALRAYRLAAGRPAITPRAIYAATVLASCLPVVFLAPRQVAGWILDQVPHLHLAVIPPVIVAVTTLLCVPALRAMQRLADRERAEIAAARKLPHAIAVLPRRGA